MMAIRVIQQLDLILSDLVSSQNVKKPTQSLENLSTELLSFKDQTSVLESQKEALEKLVEKINVIKHQIHPYDLQKSDSIIYKLAEIVQLFTQDRIQALQVFKERIPDGHFSPAGKVFRSLWKVLGSPNIWDIGRYSFYDQAPECSSTNSQKIRAIEVSMINIVIKAWKQQDEVFALQEFSRLPSHLKKEFLLLLSKRISSEEGNLEKAMAYLFAVIDKKLIISVFSDFKKKLLDHSFLLGQSYEELPEENEYLKRLLEPLARNENFHSIAKAQTNIYEALNYASNLHKNKAKYTLSTDFCFVHKGSEQERFEAFVKTSCKGYELEIALNLVDEGKQFIASVLRGKPDEFMGTDKKYIMACFIWYLTYSAVIKDQPFDQGTFVFKDYGGAVVKFFAGTAYPRLSSHFRDSLLDPWLKKNITPLSYGLDISQDGEKGLPIGKRTVNFGLIKRDSGGDWAFFKPEDYPMNGSWIDLLYHGWDYLRTRPDTFLGREVPGFRKEHTPSEIKKRFSDIAKRLEALNDTLSKEQPKTIAEMFSKLQTIKENNKIDLETIAIIDEFINGLNQKYDHLEIRQGNEVIYDPYMLMDNLEEYDPEAKDAQMRIKYKASSEEFEHAINLLKKTPMILVDNNFVKDVILGFKQDSFSSINRAKLFKQINADLELTGKNLIFRVHDKTPKDAKQLYAILQNSGCFLNEDGEQEEQAILEFITLLQQGAATNLLFNLREWFESSNHIIVKQVSPNPNEIVGKIIIDLNAPISIEICYLFDLVDAALKTLGRIEGKIHIDWDRKVTHFSALAVDQEKSYSEASKQG